MIVNRRPAQTLWISFPQTYCVDEPGTSEKLGEALHARTESHPAIADGNVSENAVSVLLKFEIMEVQQQIGPRSRVWMSISRKGFFSYSV